MSENSESRILEFSIIGTIFFAAFGVIWGVFIKSKMIVFDGLYSLISVGLSLLSLYVCNFIKVNNNKEFPFGKYILEPLVICINSLVIIAMCIVSFTDAVKVLVGGGNAVSPSLAIIYSVVSTVGSIFVYRFIIREGKKQQSELINLEGVQWLVDGAISAAVLTGFIIAIIISKTSFAHLVKYIDPIMVIVTSLWCLKLPIETFWNSFKEIIGGTVPEDIDNSVKKSVNGIKEEYKFYEAVTKVLKIGRSVRIEVDFIFDKESNIRDLAEMDNIREKLNNEIEALNYEKNINVLFTADKKACLS